MDSEFKVLDSSLCRLNLDSGFQSLVGFRIPCAVFRIPKPMIPDSLKRGRFCSSEDGVDISKCINTKISKACVLLMLMFMSRPSSLAHKLVCVASEDKASISYCQFSAVEFQTTICPLFFSGICNG